MLIEEILKFCNLMKIKLDMSKSIYLSYNSFDIVLIIKDKTLCNLIFFITFTQILKPKL
jgi:hypothetical protein